ncbi:MAG: hypothetical protein GX802_07800, partial [Clostridiales bacterium]|nr:hypothetical protein [Clostridiales bacterium]
MRICLDSQKGFMWTKHQNVMVIGYAFASKDLLQEKALAEYFLPCVTRDDIVRRLRNLNGFFSIIIKTPTGWFAAVDHVRSFPILWSFQKGEYVLFDRFSSIPKLDLSYDYNSMEEFLATGYVTGNETLYKEARQLGGGEFLWIPDGSSDDEVEVAEYYRYEYNITLFDQDKCYEILSEAYDNMTQRLIRFLDGRTAVIPLSGGHDSRLIAFFLNKHGYDNIIAYTYGRPQNSESEISKKVARFLGIPWHFVPYEKERMQELYNNNHKYSVMADYCGNGNTVPLIQEWMAIDYLTSLKVLPQNSVIVPGFTGDFLAGGHLIKRSEDNMLHEDIMAAHYKNYPWNKRGMGANNDELFTNKIQSVVKRSIHCPGEDSTTLYEAFEYFDWKERQCKHINNAVRIYELYNYQWAMPLWDKDVIAAWTAISLDLRYGRKLFIDYTEHAYA